MNGDETPAAPSGFSVPAWLSNPIALLRLFLPFMLVLGLLDSIPHPSSSGAAILDVVAGGLFRTLFILSVLFLTLLLLDRPAAEQRGPAAGLTDTIVGTMKGQRDSLPTWVLGLGLLVTLLAIPAQDLFPSFLGFLRWVSDVAFQLALAVAFTVVVAALLGIVRSREGAEGGNRLQPSTPAESAGLLRDGTLAVILLMLAVIVLDTVGQMDDMFDGITGFMDTFENAAWFLMVLITMEVILLGLAWAIERRRGVEDPDAATHWASNVPSTMAVFWDARAMMRLAPMAFGVVALVYVIFNFGAWGGFESGGDEFGSSFGVDGMFHLAVFGSDLLWIAMFGGLILVVGAGLSRLEGVGDDTVPETSVFGLYVIGAAGSLAAILGYASSGSGHDFYDSFFNTLVYRWGLAGCAIAGLIALRALYWDRTVQPE